jgi:hypothetical protein
MEELNELPKKKTPEIEDNRKKISAPAAPEIETPVPPQVMDPSATPNKRKKKKHKASKKAR